MSRSPFPVSPRILNAECSHFCGAAKDLLSTLGDVTDVEADRDYLLENIANYDVITIALRNTIDRSILDRAKNLKCIITPTTGLNHIDIDYAKEKGIDVLSLKGETSFLETITATAELAWGLLLSITRHLPQAHSDVLEGYWARDKFRGNELKGKTLGIIGYGRLGKMVAVYGKAFGMTVVVFDRTPVTESHVLFTPLPKLLAQSDIISVHLPLNNDTVGVIDREKFGQMKNGALFLNTARGELVDEAALLDALESGKIAAAGVDVLAGETSLDVDWQEKHPLVSYARTHDNLIITPHIGGLTHESVESANIFVIGKLKKYIQERRSS